MKEQLDKMTLREKIGQTAIASPDVLRKAMAGPQPISEYFKKYPFSGFYCSPKTGEANQPAKYTVKEYAEIVRELNENLPIVPFVTADLETGGGTYFEDMGLISSLMAVGAANSPELAYNRGYYWAKELRTAGINWVFGPVCDLFLSFLAPCGVRRIANRHELASPLLAETIRGIQDAGVIATAKHFPGADNDYRDTHLSSSISRMKKEDWEENQKKTFQAAIDFGVKSVMTAHNVFTALDDSYTCRKINRPATVSRKILTDLLRGDMGFDGLVITDSLGMKALAAAFPKKEDIYIEAFNAGNDILLFCDENYFEVMENAVLSGKVPIEQLDKSVERILKAKKAISREIPPPLTAEEKEKAYDCEYNIAKNAITLVQNNADFLPLKKGTIKKAVIFKLSDDEDNPDAFPASLRYMVEVLAEKGVEAEIRNTLRSKSELKQLAKENDLIIYACSIFFQKPFGMPGFSRRNEIHTLYHGLSYGMEKSVIVSFGSPTMYYNYFESVDTYLNAYYHNRHTIRAFVDGIFGEFEFTGQTPVPLRPIMTY